MSTSFEYRHQVRVALAARIAKDAMHNALSYCLFEEWKSIDAWLRDHILEAVRPFIESGDIDCVDVVHSFSEKDKWNFELKVIPTQVVSFTCRIDIGEDNEDN